MNELECMQVEHQDLKNAIDNIYRALNDLKAVDGIDDEYERLDYVAQDLEDKMGQLENLIEEAEEEQENEELAPQWEAEKRQQQRDYDSMRL